MTGPSPQPPGIRRPRRADRLHTVGAGLIAVLAVLAGILFVNVISSPSEAGDTARDATAAATAPDAAEPSPATTAETDPPPAGEQTESPTSAPPAAPASTAPPSTTPPSTTPSPKPEPSPAPVFAPVIIYNHSRIQGQAQAAVERVEAAGFRVDRIASYQGTHNTPVSTVYYDPEHEAAARTMLERVPGVERMVPRSETNIIGTGTLILVVTKDFPTDLTEG